MKQLRVNFTGKGEVKGFEFTQIKRTKHGYVYCVNTGSGVHYEVFKYKKNTQFNNVSYPKTRAFGVWAWSVGSLSRALDVLNSFNPVV